MASQTISQGVYKMGDVFVENLLASFEGMELGEEGFKKEDIMSVLFGDMKGKKKKSMGPKKPKPLTGYAYFGQQNKDKFNKQIADIVEAEGDDARPKYVTHASTQWKLLSKKEQEKWVSKAVKAFESKGE